MRDGIERAGETVARHGFTISAGEWQDDVHAVGVALKLNDGTGPYAFNCGAPAFRFTEDRLRSDIGPLLVAMVRNIELALGGAAPQSKNQEAKKTRAGGKVARVAEGIREPPSLWPRRASGSPGGRGPRQMMAQRSAGSAAHVRLNIAEG